MIPSIRSTVTPPPGPPRATRSPVRRVRFSRPRLDDGETAGVRRDLAPAEITGHDGRIKTALSLVTLSARELSAAPVLELYEREVSRRIVAAGFRQEETPLGFLAVGVYPAELELLRCLGAGGVAVRIETEGQVLPVPLDQGQRRRFEEFLGREPE